jgi:hypothetical protein
MPSPARGVLLSRFEVNARAERALARLRTTTAIVTLLAALGVLLSNVPVTAFIMAIVAALVSVFWLRQARAARKRAAEAPQYFLEVYAKGVRVGEGSQRVWLPWSEVCDIEVDEERLDIVLKKHEGAPLRVEPRYPGIAIHDLMDTLRNAWRGHPDS